MTLGVKIHYEFTDFYCSPGECGRSSFFSTSIKSFSAVAFPCRKLHESFVMPGTLPECPQCLIKTIEKLTQETPIVGFQFNEIHKKQV